MLELKNLEMQRMRHPSNQKLKDSVLLTKMKLQAILHEETSSALFRLRKKYSESAD